MEMFCAIWVYAVMQGVTTYIYIYWIYSMDPKNIYKFLEYIGRNLAILNFEQE